MKNFRITRWMFFLFLTSLPLHLFAQTRTVTGKVTTADGEPLVNASIGIKGQNRGVTTNTDGTYSIAIDNNQVLVFSYTGFITREVNTENQSVIDIQLTPSATNLDDVVIIGYGTAKRKELAGSVVTINPKSAGANTATNAAALVIGKAAGVQVLQGSGAPGAAPQIIIRGTGSFTKVDPLYVIDGIQSTREMFATIPPQDIEDITILKDAGSTAIYGSNGANGVVIITTRKGKIGQPRITVNAQYGIADAWRTMDMMNASQYFDLLTDWSAVQKAGVLPAKFTGPDADQYKRDNTVWNDRIFRKANTYDVNVTISGGTEKSTYHFFSGLVDQEAITGSVKFTRWTNRLSLTQTVGRFSFGESFLVKNDWSTGYTVPMRDFLYMPNYQNIYDSNIVGGYSAMNNGADYSGVANPLAALETRAVNSKSILFIPQLYGEVKLFPGLRFRSQFNAQINNGRNEYYQKNYKSANNIDIAREGYGAVSEGGKYTIENYFSYNKTFNDVHSLSATIGNSYINEGRGTSETVRGSGYLNDSIPNVYVAPNKTIDATTYPLGSALLSYFGRISYVYDEKYIITGSLRRDGASNLDPARNWATFPAAQLGWRFSEESFLKGIPGLSNGMLKYSWGRTGNNAVPQTASVITIWTGAGPAGSLSYPFGPTEDHANGAAATIRSSALPLVWETTDQTDIGLELGFLENRLTMSFDWYKKHSKNLLTQVLFPNSGWTGNNEQARMYYNAGDVTNSGLEAMISYTGKIGRDIEFNASVNGSYNKNRVDKIRLGEGLADQIIKAGSYWPTEYAPLGTTNLTQVGDPIASFYGYQVEGVISSTEELTALNAKAPNGVYYDATTKPGDFKFKDVNGDGFISELDKVMLGSSIPKFVYGLNLGMNYAGFDMNMVWSGTSGIKLFRSSKIFLSALQSSMHNASTDLLDRWQKEGDISANPRPGQNGNLNLVPSSWFVENGDYLRLRNFTIGYTVPLKSNNLLNKTFSNIRVYVAAQNLFTFTKYKGYDPEVGNPDGNPTDILNRGIDAGVALPQPRTFLFGVQIGFN